MIKLRRKHPLPVFEAAPRPISLMGTPRHVVMDYTVHRNAELPAVSSAQSGGTGDFGVLQCGQ